MPHCLACHQTSLVRVCVAPHKWFPSQGPEPMCDASAGSEKMNHSILVIFNLTIITLGLKSQKNTNTLDLYTGTHMLTLKRTVLDGQFPWTINNSWARMTHRYFICFKCPPQQQMQSCQIEPIAELLPLLCPVFTRAPNLSLTLHPSCDRLRVAVIEHVHSDGSLSIFLSLSFAFYACYSPVLLFFKITTVKKDSLYEEHDWCD